MIEFVLDGSVTLAWCFEDESEPFADAILGVLSPGAAIVPSIWPLEIANVLAVCERRKRIKPKDSDRFLSILSDFSIMVDSRAQDLAFGDLLELARKHQMTVYDAAYLELAMRLRLPLASLDTRLIAAAKAVKVPLFLP